MSEESPSAPTRAFWILGCLALLWNLMGVMAYIMQVTMGEEALAALPEAERALYESIPVWATSAYAIAVFAGVAACVGLLLRKSWAVPLFAVSLAGILVQMSQAIFLTNALEVRGFTAVIMPMVLIAIATFLLAYSRQAKQRGWLA